jgi:hypothetical protein
VTAQLFFSDGGSGSGYFNGAGHGISPPQKQEFSLKVEENFLKIQVIFHIRIKEFIQKFEQV